MPKTKDTAQTAEVVEKPRTTRKRPRQRNPRFPLPPKPWKQRRKLPLLLKQQMPVLPNPNPQESAALLLP